MSIGAGKMLRKTSSHKASPNAMEYWAMQYLNYVEIKLPISLRERIKNDLQKTKEKNINEVR